MSVVDDFGRTEADVGLLLTAVYPLRVKRMSETKVEQQLQAAVDAELVRLYESGGKRYLEMVDFKQQRRTKSKCPEPPDLPAEKHALGNGAAPAKQKIANDHLGGGGGGVVFEGGGGVARERAPERATPVETVQALKAVGIADAQPGHPTLVALLDAGTPVQQFLDAAPKSQGKGKPFEYLLAAVKGQATDAATIRGPPATTPPAKTWKPDPPMTPEQQADADKARELAVSAVRRPTR